jgi:fucose 4-O-acetylase-like acetyltransferase
VYVRAVRDGLLAAPTAGSSTATSGDARASAPHAPDRTGRDPWFDNVRLVSAVLVVAGHCLLASSGEDSWAYAWWSALWPFRLPAFVVLAGLFSSELPLTRSRLVVLARDLLLVFLLFSAIEAGQTWLAGGEPSGFAPEFGLWFLLVLLCWRVLLPFVARAPHLFVWAVGAALLAGLVPAIGEELALSRMIVYFPLFLLGWRLRSLDLRATFERRLRVVAVVSAVMLAVLLFVLYRTSVVGYSDFRMEVHYTGDVVSQVGQAIVRSGLLAAGAIGAVALICLAPRRGVRFWTYLGTGGMFIYLLHLVILKQLMSWGVLDRVDSPFAYALMLVVAVAAALALASPPVRALTGPLVQPRTLLRWAQHRGRVR